MTAGNKCVRLAEAAKEIQIAKNWGLIRYIIMRRIQSYRGSVYRVPCSSCETEQNGRQHHLVFCSVGNSIGLNQDRQAEQEELLAFLCDVHVQFAHAETIQLQKSFRNERVRRRQGKDV